MNAQLVNITSKTSAPYFFHRNANVEVNPVVDDAGSVSARVVIDNQREHIFNSSSKVSQSLGMARNPDEMKLATVQLQERMNGGHFFFVQDSTGHEVLIDHRDGHYPGFVHNDNAIENMMNVIGIEEGVSNLRRSGMRLNTAPSAVALSHKWSVEDFHINGYLEGGNFSSGINFAWSPFMNFVRGIFEITRQICTNGMMGTTELINSKIPLQNRWEEHLELANIQMQNKVQGMVANRLALMGEHRSTVSELQLVTKHARERLNETVDLQESNRLSNLVKVIDPIVHLSQYYQPAVFQDSNVSARLPGHLSQFDLWNIITEMYSHTSQSAESSDGGLQRLANKMLFPNVDEVKGRIVDVVPLESSFSSPDRAFFGVH